jgi:membrane protein required for colicin V production
MTWFDVAVVIVLGLSVLLGILHGIVKELMALAAWIAAFLVARQFAASAAALLPAGVQPDGARTALAFTALVVATLLASWIVTYVLSRIVKASGMSAADRSLGAAFGLVRGLAVVIVCVLVAGMTPIVKDPGWQQAWLAPPLEEIATAARAWLPESLKTRIRYD